MDVNAFGITHVGKQRQHNEDSFLVAAEAKLYLVADGMGGHAAGEIASRIAVDSISEFILHTKEDDGTWPHAYDEQYRRSPSILMRPRSRASPAMSICSAPMASLAWFPKKKSSAWSQRTPTSRKPARC